MNVQKSYSANPDRNNQFKYGIASRDGNYVKSKIGF